MSTNQICILFFLALANFSLATAYLQYEAACKPEDAESGNEDLICDPYRALRCRNNLCGCHNLPDMKYFPNSTQNGLKGNCLVLRDGNCEPVEYNEELTVDINCIENAECIYGPSFSRCRCKDDFLETSERTCVPRGVSHNDPCSESEPCNAEENLVCRHGTCQCPNPLEQFFYNWRFNGVTKRGCFGVAFSPCQPSNSTAVPCLPDAANCLEDSGSSTGFSCVCNEAEGWKTSFARMCYRDFEAECGNTDAFCDFSAGLICYNNKCVCGKEPDQEWDENLKVCASLERKPCTLTHDNDNYFCKSGLTCVPNAGLADGICRNVTGLSTTTTPSNMDSTTNKNDAGTGGGNSWRLSRDSIIFISAITFVNML